MHTTESLLDAYKAKKALPSDYALAKAIGVTKQRISQYRRGMHAIGDDRAIDLARELNLDPGEVLISLQAERAKKAANFAAFDALSALLRRLSSITALVLAVFLFLPAESAQASIYPAFDNNANYAKRRTRRALRRLRCAALRWINPAFIILRILRGPIHTS